jgi:hypothetical protein
MFKDSKGWKRVCPFYELHGEWSEDTMLVQGPVTPQLLGKFGQNSSDLKWNISVANWKAYNYSESSDDQINATVRLTGTDFTKHVLEGRSPPTSKEPLVPFDKYIELGSVQLIKPPTDDSVIRIRFTPPHGWVYGPTNLNERLTDEAVQMEMYKIDRNRLIINPNAAFCSFNVRERGDSRTIPTAEYAMDKNGISLGIVDDISDGTISCSLGDIAATSWIVVGPPKINPDRRPFISLADTLKDRVERDDLNDPHFIMDYKQTVLEIHDLFERIRETVEVMNVDAQNDRAVFENQSRAAGEGFSSDAITDAINKAYPIIDPLPGRPLPLTDIARQKHRRFSSIEVLEDVFRERPEIIEEMIRKPVSLERYYDRKMPLAMRGTDGYPLHITRRQYDLIRLWQKELLRGIKS